MRKMQVSSVAQLVLRTETVGLTGPKGLFPLDQGPIPSLSCLILFLKGDGVVSISLRRHSPGRDTENHWRCAPKSGGKAMTMRLEIPTPGGARRSVSAAGRGAGRVARRI